MTTAPAPAPARNRWRILLTPGWFGVLLLAVLFAAACYTILAPWQFDRHAERSERNAVITSSLNSAPVPVTDLLGVDEPPGAGDQYRTVTATGTFLADQQEWVRLRQVNASPASEVILPFRLTDGTLLLVDRGYMRVAALAVGDQTPPPPTGTVSISGRVQLEQPDPLDRAAIVTDGRPEVYGISTSNLRARSGDTPVLQGFIQLTDTSPGVLEAVEVPQTDPGPFLSYAWQWLTFGTIALIAAVFFSVREVLDPVTGGPRPPRPAAPADTARSTGSKRFSRSELYDKPEDR